MVSIFQELPEVITDRLAFYDVGSLQVRDEPCTIPIHILKSAALGSSVLVNGNVCQSPLPSFAQFGDPQFYWNNASRSSSSVAIHVPGHFELPMQDEEILLFRVKCTSYDSQHDHYTLEWLDDQSLWIPKTKMPSHEMTLVELFAGGYGGWSHALKHLQSLGFPKPKVIAVEANSDFAMQYSVTHTAVLCRESSHISTAILEHADRDLILNLRIQDRSWHQFLAFANSDVWVASPPCQPFSRAGKETGLLSNDGQVFVECLLMARIHRPSLLLLEEVEAVQAHKHFKWITEIAHYSGYRFLHSSTHDLVDLAPCRRNRWLGMLIAEEKAALYPNVWEDWEPKPFASPFAFGAYIPSSDEAMAQFSLSFEEKMTYLDPSLLPSNIRTGQDKNPFATRVPGLHCPMPTFMARYGAQHKLPREHLLRSGLFGHFFPERMTFRYLKPAEAMLLHGHIGLQCFVNKEVGWETIGNSISMAHSTLLLSNAFHILRLTEQQPKPARCVSALIEQRWKADTVQHVHREQAMVVAKDDLSIGRMLASLSKFDRACSEADENASWQPGEIFCPELGVRDFRVLLGPEDWMLPSCQLQPGNERQIKFEDSQLATSDHDNGNVNVPPTVPFSSFVEISMQYPNQHVAEAQVTSDCTYETLLQCWNFRVRPFAGDVDRVPSSNSEVEYSEQATTAPVVFETMNHLDQMDVCQGVHVAPAPVNAELQAFSTKDFRCTPIMIVDCQCPQVFSVKTGSTFQVLPVTGHSAVFDAVGSSRDQIEVSKPEVLFVRRPPEILDSAIISLAQHLLQVRFEVRIPSHTDNLVWVLTGPSEECQQMIQFVKAVLSPDWLSMHGRQVFCQNVEETKWIIVFQPLPPSFAVPAEIMSVHAAIRLTKAVLQAFCTDDDNGVDLSMRYQHFRIMQGKFDPTLSLSQLLEPLTVIMSPMLFMEAPRLVAYGCTWKHGACISDIVQKKRDHDGKPKPISCFLRPAISGGGNKQEHLHSLHAGLSSLAMMYGAKVQETPQIVQTLMQELGVPRVHHLLYVEASDRKQQQFLALCRECNVTLPSTVPITQQVEARVNRGKRLRQQADMQSLDVAKYRLDDGYFRLPSQDPAPVLQRLSNQQSGIFMTGPAELQPWTCTHQRVTADALAVFMVGRVDDDEKSRLQKHFAAQSAMAPAQDEHGRQVLLAGLLVQLGEQEILLPKDEMPTIPTLPAQVIAITLWADEFALEQWKAIIDHPVKFAKQLLESEALHGAIRSPG